jgi:hypothetical protein
MKAFEPFAFSPDRCREELVAFKVLLDSRPELSERADILPFFGAHRHLAAFTGSLNPNLHVFDRLATEYDLFGDFRADVVVGDSQANAYTLIEFEDAKRESVFRADGRYTLAWSPRFEHGFSQLVDWFWKIEDQQKNDDFRHRFGTGVSRFFAVLVIGRSSFLDERGRARMAWRSDRVLINSRPTLCFTFDDLHRHLDRKLQSMSQIAAIEADPRPARP